MSTEITRTTFFGRIGNLFRRPNRDMTGQEPIEGLLDLPVDDAEPQSTGLAAHLEEAQNSEPRTTFLRPWAKREQVADQLQNGVVALTDLMGTLRDTLEKDSHRQDELLSYLSRLPAAIETLPENSRVQGEALKAIQIGIEQQNTQQNRLAQVLERMHEGDAEQRTSLQGIHERIGSIAAHEEAIGSSLTTVGLALQSASVTAESSARVLENLRDNLSSRDSDLERIIRRQNTRFTTMLTVAIVMSMAALTAVVVFGYLGYETLSHVAK